MTRSERACQIWGILAWAARNRQSLTYANLAKLIGGSPRSLGRFLEPIQSYCMLQQLPPLTILVVQTSTGMPGSGFTAASASEYAKAHMKVFRFDWLEHGNPGSDKLEEAVRKLPSIGLRKE